MSVAEYDTTAVTGLEGRALEARALMRCAVGLNDARQTGDSELLLAATTANARLWLFFYSEIERGNVKLPTDVASNIVSLAGYVAKVTPQAMGGDAKVLDALVSINRHIAAGLSDGATESETASAVTTAVGLTA